MNSTGTIQPAPASSHASERPAPIRLPFLDGLRGAAALLVVVTHLWGQSFLILEKHEYPLWFQAMSFFRLGHYFVAVFIVLSGFCLMLPVAKAKGAIKGGVREYLKRRARRILPPYYASLAISAALLALFPAIRIEGSSVLDTYRRNDMLGAFIGHLFLVHNLVPQWSHRIDGPLWSVATEWQIYFLFPFLLLPIWRRWGYGIPILIGLALGFCTINTSLRYGCFWYIGLFAIGMAASGLSIPEQMGAQIRKWTWRRLWGLFTVTALTVFLIAQAHPELTEPCYDVIVGTLTAFLLIDCTRQTTSRAPGEWSAALCILSSRLMAGLGKLSYSIYLMHLPVLLLETEVIRPYRFSAPVNFFWYMTIGLPIILGLCYLFHCLFERPFTRAASTSGSA